MTVFVTFGVNSNIPFSLNEDANVNALKMAAAPITGGQNIDARINGQLIADNTNLFEGAKVELIKAAGNKG